VARGGGATTAPSVTDVAAAQCVLQAAADGEGNVQVFVSDNYGGQYLTKHHLVVRADELSDKVTGHRDLAEVDEDPVLRERVVPTADCLAATDPEVLATCLFALIEAPVTGPGGCECDAFPGCGP
jgi:hypothetical protein